MTTAVSQFLLSSLVIIGAGVLLTRCADALADLTGLGRLLVGSLLLAGATSLPELLVQINAVRLGAPDLAVGGLIGACLFNLLILATLDLSRQSRGRMFSRLAAAHALSVVSSISLIALAAMGLLLGEKMAAFVVGRLSLFSIALLIAYALSVRMLFHDQRLSAAEHTSGGSVVLPPQGGLTLPRAIAGFLAGALLILVAAPYLAHAADEIAEYSGLGETFVGTTLVALATTLPELVASLTALRLGAFDLAIGNVFGSNAFNMVLLSAVDLAQPGSLFAVVSQTHALMALAAILVTAVAVLGQLYRVEKRRWFVEPDAVLVIVLVVTALTMLYYLR